MGGHRVAVLLALGGIPPEGGLRLVVGDAVAERDAVREVGDEAVVAAVVGDHAVDHRAAGGVVAHVEVQRVAALDALHAGLALVAGAVLLGAEVAQADVRDRLRRLDVEQDDVGPPLGRALDRDVAGQVEHLGRVGDALADGDRRVGELERAVEGHPPAVDRLHDPPVVQLGEALGLGRLGGGDDDLVARQPAAGVGHRDRAVARAGARRQVASTPSSACRPGRARRCPPPRGRRRSRGAPWCGRRRSATRRRRRRRRGAGPTRRRAGPGAPRPPRRCRSR